jgi:hypothetical protein
MSQQDIRNALLLYGLEDMQQLWWIAGTVHKFTRIPRDTPELVEPTLNAIRDLLEAEHVIAGDLAKDPEDGLLMVRSWGLSPEDTVKRIRQEWGELKEPLNIGHVMWIELTEKGRREAKRLDEMGCDPFKYIPRD